MNKPSFLKDPIKTDSVSNRVLNKIKEALINGELKPGERLPSETELMSYFNVGKSSVREAVKMLQALGVVETRQGDGTFIRQEPVSDTANSLVFQLILEQGTSKELLDFRVMFEIAYTIMAMRNATPEDIKEIERTISNLEYSIIKGAQKAEDDLAFHLAILKSTHNNYVILVGETILQLFKASIKVSMKNIPETAVKDHKKIFKAFCDRDEEKLKKAILESFEGWENSLKKGG